MTKKEKYEALPDHLKNMVICWRFPNVLHKDIADFTGGALSKSRLANLKCEGEAPPTFRIFKRNASDIVDMTYWIYKRTQQMNKKEN